MFHLVINRSVPSFHIVIAAIFLFPVSLALCTGCAHDAHHVKRYLPHRPLVASPPCETPAPVPAPKPSEDLQHEEPATGEIQHTWPLECPPTRISSRFGYRRRGGRAHKGVDMEAPHGTAVIATGSGKTTFSGHYGAYGNIIVIDHGNDYETAYAHLDECLVKKGDRVELGQVIGRVGRTGNATAFHLHYEVRRNGDQIDPAPWLPE